LFEGWNKIADNYNINTKMIGYPIRMTLQSRNSQGENSPSLKAYILQEMVKKGFFISPGPTFISYSHKSKQIDETLVAFENVCKEIKKKIFKENYEKYLEGNLPQTVWVLQIPPTKKR